MVEAGFPFLLPQLDDRSQILKTDLVPAILLPKSALLVRQERCVPAKVSQPLVVIDEGTVVDAVKRRHGGARPLLGTEVAQQLTIGRFRDRLQLLLGRTRVRHSCFLVQHRQYAPRGRRHRGPQVPRSRSVDRLQRYPDIEASATGESKNPPPPEDMATAVNMLERRHH
jgi:hypothetical protein